MGTNPIESDPIFARVVMGCFPLHSNGFTEVEGDRSSRRTRDNRNTVLCRVIRRNVIRNSTRKDRWGEYSGKARKEDSPYVMTNFSRDCCKSTLVSWTTSDNMGPAGTALRVYSINHNTRWLDTYI